MTIGRIIDVSSDQHPNGAAINWTQVAQAGVTAVFIKATQGTTYVNPYFQSDMIAAQKAGLYVCAYHYADMGNPVAEAQFFAKMASRFARMLDFETNTNVAWARTFLQTLGLPASELITYGSLDTLKDFYVQLPSMAFFAAYQQLWPGMGVCWQFTDAATIPGITGNVDEDSWHGDESQYDALFQVNTPAPTPPNYSGGLMFDGLAASKQDNFNATLKFMWGQIRSDPLTTQDIADFWYAYNLPADQQGYGGSMFSVVSGVIDQAATKGTLRPTWAGAV
jgi:hypothetical protein